MMKNNMMKNKFLGSLFGLAAGDAVGTTLEFTKPGTFKPIDDMYGGGPFKLIPGQWTDDTSMALCLADSIVTKGFDMKDQLCAYCAWCEDGFLSSTGYCFDVGGTTVQSLYYFAKTGNPFAGDTHEKTSGNGSIMRLTPVVMAYLNTPDFLDNVINSSRTTHGSRLCVDSCAALSYIIAKALQSGDKKEVLSPNVFNDLPYNLDNRVMQIVEGSYKYKEPPEIESKGFVLSTLEAALWAFYHSSNFKDGCLKAVNLGGDADTVGAVYGQIAGAFYGLEGIPHSWLNKIWKKPLIEDYAIRLYNLNEKLVSELQKD